MRRIKETYRIFTTYSYATSVHANLSDFLIKASHHAVHPNPKTSSSHADTGTISSNTARTIRIVHIIDTFLPLAALQTGESPTDLLRRANPGTVLRNATSNLGIMHARLI